MKALVLGGGGAKGAFQVGAERYLREQAGYEYDIVMGISAGALNAVMLAQSKYDELFDLWYNIRNSHIYDGDLGLWGMAKMLLLRKRSVLSNKPLMRLLEQHVDIRDIQKIMHVGTVNLNTGRYVELRAGKQNLPLYKTHDEQWDADSGLTIWPEQDGWAHVNRRFRETILASASIPMMFAPQDIFLQGKNFVDGGVRNMTPLKSVLQYDPDEIVIINCNPQDINSTGSKYTNPIEIGVRSLQIAMNEIFVQDLKSFLDKNNLVRQTDVPLYSRSGKQYRYFKALVIEPETAIGSTLDFNEDNARELIHQGYLAAEKAVKGAAKE